MTQPDQKPHRSKQDYATPRLFLAAVKALLGIDRFAFDLAADATNTVADGWYDEACDALSQDWTTLGINREWLWLNPPFGVIRPWAKKCAESGLWIAFLVPAAVGSNWFRDYVDGRARVLLLNGRLAFMPDKPNWLYPKDCILVLYGREPGYEVWTWNAR